MRGYCQDFSAFCIQQYDRASVVAQQSIRLLLQSKIDAQTNVQAGRGLAINHMIPPDTAGWIPLQPAQPWIQAGLQPGLPIGRIGITGNGSQVRILVNSGIIAGFPLREAYRYPIPVEQTAAFYVTVSN